MPMSQKDYELIAHAIHLALLTESSFLERLADAFYVDNPKFKRDKWMKACVPDGWGEYDNPVVEEGDIIEMLVEDSKKAFGGESKDCEKYFPVGKHLYRVERWDSADPHAPIFVSASWWPSEDKWWVFVEGVKWRKA